MIGATLTAPRLEPLRAGGALPRPVLDEAEVIEHREIAPEYWLLTLNSERMAARALPGQFAMLTVAREHELAPVLPRPMALYDWDVALGTVQFLYRLVGEGTRLLATWRRGERMTVVGPLGHGFALHPATRHALLLGRGIGTCSLTALARVAVGQGVRVDAVVSARTEQALIGTDLYRRVGVAQVMEVTDTAGSSAVEQLEPHLRAVIGAVAGPRQVFVCGSRRLLALGAELGGREAQSVQASLEAHMACGLGYCHGCSTGYPGLDDEAPLVCTDGPVFAVAWPGGA